MYKKRKNRLKYAKMPRTLVTLSNSNTFVLEQFRTIRANVNFSLPGDELKSLLITSSLPGEGKSTIAANLAVVFAQEGKKVLLVDADLRKPTLHFSFNVPHVNGFSHVLIGKYFYFNAVQETSVEGLSVLTSGPIPPNPSELLLSRNMDAFLKEVKEKFDLVIFDAPPVLAFSDAQILGNKCDATVIIVNAGILKKDEFLRTEELVTASKARVIGVILNNFKVPKKFYKDYYSYSL